ncbi:MAG: ABC transporter ATP-binding protein [Burkholderiales bacterium]
MTEPAALLEVRDLQVRLKTEDGELDAVSRVSFTVHEGETLALVGESGAGKSVTSLAIMRLLQAGGRSHSASVAGKIMFRGNPTAPVDLLKLDSAGMRSLRGRALSMIFQEPMTSLNPVMRVGEQIAEAIHAHETLGHAAALSRAVDMLRRVGIPDPPARARTFPHELSGGMRQRVMIAMALACHPRLLIADEPTTALDVTVQAQVLDLIRGLQREFNMAVLFITHDLGVVAQMADRVAVMYAGKIVEAAPVDALFADPSHPYTRGLLASMPDAAKAGRALHPIPGSMPALSRLPAGCAFHPRCAAAIASRCDRRQPPSVATTTVRSVSCWLHAQ